jgi:hypothetical protein
MKPVTYQDMKKCLLIVFFVMAGVSASAQFGVSYHQSSIPNLGFNFEYKDRYFAELRFGPNQYFENLALELTANYIFLNTEDYDFYGGIGGRTIQFEGLVIPAGVNIYPFDNKDFGFHLEAAAMLGENSVLRGSWGIRYRFGGTRIQTAQKDE